MMTDHGLAYLVWRDGRPYLAAKSGETVYKKVLDLGSKTGRPAEASRRASSGLT